MVQQFVNQLSNRLAPKSVSRSYGVLRAMFNYAVGTDFLYRSPCRGIKLPRIEPRARDVLEPTTVAAIAAATPFQYRPMVWLGALVGLRFSEVAGLRVGSIDFLRQSLSVTATVTKDGKGGAVLGPPKSAASRRTVAIPGFLVKMLADHLARLGVDASDVDAFIFTAPDGGLLRYTNWLSRVWVPACRSAGLEHIGFHDLRRLSATTLVHEGVDIKTAQARLGHSDVRLTIGLYAQVVAAADRAAADRLGEILYLPSTEATDDETAQSQVTMASDRARSRTDRAREGAAEKIVRGKRTVRRGNVVEVSGLEPPTSTLRTWRSTS